MSLTAGVQGPLKGPEALKVFVDLSCYLSLVFKHSDTKLDKKKHSRSNFKGGGGARACCTPPLNPPLIMAFKREHESHDNRFSHA